MSVLNLVDAGRSTLVPSCRSRAGRTGVTAFFDLVTVVERCKTRVVGRNLRVQLDRGVLELGVVRNATRRDVGDVVVAPGAPCPYLVTIDRTAGLEAIVLNPIDAVTGNRVLAGGQVAGDIALALVEETD